MQLAVIESSDIDQKVIMILPLYVYTYSLKG